MTDSSPPPPPPATLDDVAGRGYAVVESLPSLGKGRSCTGVFIAPAAARAELEALARTREGVSFTGVVHSRHRSARATLRVEVQRVEPEDDVRGVTVEFTARDVPYDLVG